MLVNICLEISNSFKIHWFHRCKHQLLKKKYHKNMIIYLFFLQEGVSWVQLLFASKKLIALPGVIKAEWASGFVQWHGSYFMALPNGQWLCFYHCSTPLCSTLWAQLPPVLHTVFPAWEWLFYTTRTKSDKHLTSSWKTMLLGNRVVFSKVDNVFMALADG